MNGCIRKKKLLSQVIAQLLWHPFVLCTCGLNLIFYTPTIYHLNKKSIEKISMTELMTRLTYIVFWLIFSSIYGMENAASNYASQVLFCGSGQEACCFAKRVATLFCLFCMFFG